MHLTRNREEGWLRLGVAVGLNIALVLCSRSFAKWGSYDQEAHGDLMALALAAPAVVTTIPLYWRSEPWQAALALPLLFLPGLCLWGLVDTILSH